MPPPIPLLFGPILIGAFFNTILYGILIVQSLIYFQTRNRDKYWLKCFVFYLFIVETINSGLVIGLVYEPLILKYGQPGATTFFPIRTTGLFLLFFFLRYDEEHIAVSTPVQFFIAWRIIVISGKRYIPVIIGLFALISTGGAIWLACAVIHVQEFARKPELHWPALTWLIATMIADVIITVSLVYSLAKRKTGVVQTDDAVNKIIRMTIQTGLATAIFVILEVLCFLLVPNSTLNFIWDLALSKLYTSTLLSTLNARTNFRTNVLFTEESSDRESSAMHDLQFALSGRSKSFDISPSRNESRRTVENIEIGIVSVREVSDI